LVDDSILSLRFLSLFGHYKLFSAPKEFMLIQTGRENPTALAVWMNRFFFSKPKTQEDATGSLATESPRRREPQQVREDGRGECHG
jgi:hypothetical protein